MNPTPQILAIAKRIRYEMEKKKLQGRYMAAAGHIKNAAAYAHLHGSSLSIAGVSIDAAQEACVNVVLPELNRSGIFAGIKTALEFSVKVSDGLKRPLRVVALRRPNIDSEQLRSYLKKEFGRDIEVSVVVVYALNVSGIKISPNDEWVVTHWTTAHALDVAVKLGVVASNKITYLIQDYEPGFHPWSTDFALAKSTYSAGFRSIVNSSLLQAYLEKNEGLIVDPRYVFAPSIDMVRLRRAAEQRLQSSIPVIFFYARPSKPRNLYAIGIAALHLLAAELEKKGLAARFISAGERHSNVRLSSQHVLVSRGKLPWDEYFETLGKADVVLSLQHSPHPSHPPLDAVTCGCYAVTNELGNTRGGLHPRLLVAESNPADLALQLMNAFSLSRSDGCGGFDSDFHLKFGISLSEVADNLAVNILEGAGKGKIHRAES